MLNVPGEVWAPLALVAGYLLRPIEQYLRVSTRRRNASADRREKFQFETLTELTQSLEVLLTGGHAYVPADIDLASARVESLTFRVYDDRLRELLERLASQGRGGEEWRATYGDVMRRLGEVLRSL